MSVVAKKILELQKEGGEGGTILNPEQTQAIDSFRGEQVKTRKELRAVEYNLRKDIDGLGRDVMLLNVIGVPLGAALLVLGWTLRRNRRR